MKKLQILALATLALLAAPVASLAQAPPWTSVCSAGATIDELSRNRYVVSGGGTAFEATSLAVFVGPMSPLPFTVTARYNVTDIGQIDEPGWTTFQLGYTDTAPGVITATLYRVRNCSGEIFQLCQITSDDGRVNFCELCTGFPEEIDFTDNLYFVRVDVRRDAPGGELSAHTLRIF